VKYTHKGVIPLETKRLLLRPIHRDDAEAIFENWASDPETTRFMLWNCHRTIDDTHVWLDTLEKNASRPDCYDSWGIVLRNTGELIGSMGAFWRAGESDTMEFGYIISRKYWGNGYTTEAAREMIRFLRDEIGIRHFFACHAEKNPASGKVLVKLGMRETGAGIYRSFDGIRTFPSVEYRLDLSEDKRISYDPGA